MVWERDYATNGRVYEYIFDSYSIRIYIKFNDWLASCCKPACSGYWPGQK